MLTYTPFVTLLSLFTLPAGLLVSSIRDLTVGECGTVVALGYPDFSGSQDILRAAIGEPWRLELQWGIAVHSFVDGLLG